MPDPAPARPVDPLAELLIDRFHLDQAPDDACSLTYSEVAALASTGGLEQVIGRLVDDYAKLAAGYDLVIIVGSDFTGPTPGTELEFNAELAANLGAPALPVVGAAGMPSTRVPAAVAETARVLASQGCAVVATVVSRVAPGQVEQVRATAIQAQTLPR